MKSVTQTLIPREHGATAMLLTPFFAAAILLHKVYWPELVALLAIVAACAMKDPLVVIARQRFIWRQEHSETPAAKRAAVLLGIVLLGCGISLTLGRDWRPWIPFISGGGAFTALAVAVNVRNQQRSEWFQVTSAVALSSTCFIACLSVIGRIPDWCWLVWIFCALQAASGIFVVHARLEARIAARKGTATSQQGRRTAYFAQAVVIATAVLFVALEQVWIAAALILTATFHLLELRSQSGMRSLQRPLKTVGLQALGQSILSTLIIIIGLWQS